MSNRIALSIQGLTVSYGGIQAVKGVDFHVLEGELISLIGCNGAGKTTTLKALAGLLPFRAHRSQFHGHDLQALPAHTRLPLGLCLVPEGRGLFKRMSVEENLCIGGQFTTATKDEIFDRLDAVYTLFPTLKDRRTQSAGTLSGGEQQMVAIGRSMMGNPRVLMLDEPSMGLAPMMVQRIFDVIKHIAKQGTTVLLVEQNAHIALEMSDRAYVMDSGLIEIEGQAKDLLNDPRVREAYLGEST